MTDARPGAPQGRRAAAPPGDRDGTARPRLRPAGRAAGGATGGATAARRPAALAAVARRAGPRAAGGRPGRA